MNGEKCQKCGKKIESNTLATVKFIVHGLCLECDKRFYG